MTQHIAIVRGRRGRGLRSAAAKARKRALSDQRQSAPRLRQFLADSGRSAPDNNRKADTQ